MCLKQIQTTGFGHHSITILFLVFRDRPQSYVQVPVLCGCLLRCILFCLLFQFLFQFFLLRGNIINKKCNSFLCVNVYFFFYIRFLSCMNAFKFCYILLYCIVRSRTWNKEYYSYLCSASFSSTTCQRCSFKFYFLSSQSLLLLHSLTSLHDASSDRTYFM